jgi:hypothetical protein
VNDESDFEGMRLTTEGTDNWQSFNRELDQGYEMEGPAIAPILSNWDSASEFIESTQFSSESEIQSFRNRFYRNALEVLETGLGESESDSADS